MYFRTSDTKLYTVPMSRSMSRSRKPSLFGLFKPYRPLLGLLLLLTFFSNGLNLLLPRYIEWGIDSYPQHPDDLPALLWPFLSIAVGILVLSLLQSGVKAYTSEKVAFDLRASLVAKIAQQPFTRLQELGTATLLTRLTSDVEEIKLFISQVIVAMVSSLLLVLGASAMLLWMNWKLALGVLVTLPLLGVGFYSIFKQGRSLFGRSQSARDKLNRVINESILGAALIRVLNSSETESYKFSQPNAESRNIGFSIVSMFAALVPMINFVAGLGSLIILLLGGHLVIQKQLSLGELAAFNSYLLMLIFPILVMGFTSQQMARASASYKRLHPILEWPENPMTANTQGEPVRALSVQHLALELDGRPVLRDISFEIAPGTRTAILGPTAAGKTVLVQLLCGLFAPDSGEVRYNNTALAAGQGLPPGLAIVFQDSIVFQLSLRENIAFGPGVSDADVQKAIEVAELSSFIAGLPQGLETQISERGVTLSGGQKQRLMLARALAQSPSMLLLDDFTARVDPVTEQRILANLRREYPDLSLISITQKVESVKDFDHILLLMEGELLASGSHTELCCSSPEYMQIYQSQQSTANYEAH